MRNEDNVYISASSLIFELRVCRSLLREHNTQVFASDASTAAQRLVDNMIEVIEDGTKLFQATDPPVRPSPEAGMGPELER